MNHLLAAAAGSLTAVGVGAVGFARAWPVPTGRHRAARSPGQLTAQEFVHCTVCQVETVATRHGDLLLCTEGHTVEGSVS